MVTAAHQLSLLLMCSLPTSVLVGYTGSMATYCKKKKKKKKKKKR